MNFDIVFYLHYSIFVIMGFLFLIPIGTSFMPTFNKRDSFLFNSTISRALFASVLTPSDITVLNALFTPTRQVKSS